MVVVILCWMLREVVVVVVDVERGDGVVGGEVMD